MRRMGALSLAVLTLPLAAAAPGDVHWPMHGGVDNIRYSPLTQINRSNVAQTAGRVDLRLARRLQGLRDAEQPRRRRRRALRDDADAEGRGGRRGDRAGDLEVRPERRRDGAHAFPPPRRHGARRSRVRDATATFSGRARQARPAEPIASFGTDGRIDLREGLDKPAEGISVSASTPGVDLRGPAHPREQRARDAARDRPVTSAPST